MTNFDKMEQNFVALTEEELMEVDGGALPLVLAGVSIGRQVRQQQVEQQRFLLEEQLWGIMQIDHNLIVVREAFLCF